MTTSPRDLFTKAFTCSCCVLLVKFSVLQFPCYTAFGGIYFAAIILPENVFSEYAWNQSSVISKFNEEPPLRKKRPYSEFFWSVHSLIQTEYGDLQSKSPYSIWMREKTDQKSSEYGNTSRSALYHGCTLFDMSFGL